MERIALLPDIHADDHDPRAVELACKVIEAFKPDRIIFLGDVLDFSWCSHFDHDLGSLPGALEREVRAWKQIAQQFLSAAGGNVRAQVIQGNHEARFQRGFLWQYPALAGWRGLGWNDVLQLSELRIEFIPESKLWLAGKRFLITHGKIVRNRSGYSATAELELRSVSGASGHTHRMGQIYRTYDGTGDVKTWTECGCLCNNPPKYGKPNEGIADWQQGLALMHANEREFRVPDLVPFWRRKGKLRTRYQESEFEA